jgi:hypothetical protein
VAYLDRHLNTKSGWEDLLKANQRRVEVDIDEVERVLDLARRTPGLAQYEKGLCELSVFFAEATRECRETDPESLSGLVSFWEEYRAVVIQRYTGITPAELRAADKIVGNVFGTFVAGVPEGRISYSPDAVPLVYGGPGGPDNYYTYPPDWSRPFAIINLPHAAFDNVWQWLALPHETGHDLYASIDGLETELTQALAARMQDAVGSGEVNVPAVHVAFSYEGHDYEVNYTPEDFLAKVWAAWANESQADMVGILSCGGAAAVGLQQIIGFEAYDTWELTFEGAELAADGPEAHPTSYVRNALNIAALRALDPAHASLADEIEQRFRALRPDASHIEWWLGPDVPLTGVDAGEMVKSAEIAADVLLNHSFGALGGKSYREIMTFTGQDQAITDACTKELIAGHATFSQVDGAQPRHALAATIFAFEKKRGQADSINRTFVHFC